MSLKLSILYVGESAFVFLCLLIPADHGLCCDVMEDLQSICFSDLFLEKVDEYYVCQCILNIWGVVCLFLTTLMK